MTNLTIKNLPRGLYERFKARAERNRRSLNSEVIHCLEQAAGTAPIDIEATLASIRAVRERARLPYLTEAELRAAREDGRA
jgi:plasmid stability protein